MGKLCVFFSASIVTLSFAISAPADPGSVIREKKGTHPQATPCMVQQKKEISDLQNGLGVKEIPRSDGGTDKIYYSIVTPEEQERKEQEEKEKEDRSWELLPSIVIDKRTR